MGGLTRALAGLLRHSARLVPAGRRAWVEAVQAEAGQVPPGWPRLRWLAGGLWLVTREATVTMLFLLAALAGLAAAWLLPGAADPEDVRIARGLQGLLAGSVAGGACGLLLTNFYVVAVVLMIIGPVVGAVGGAVGGFVAAGHPLRARPARSWAAGVFVRF